MIQLIVLLPLLAAAIAGLGNKALGKLPAKIVTTGALFASCAMSWPIFLFYNCISAALWSAAYGAGAYLFGSAFRHFFEAYSTWPIFVIAALVCVIGMVGTYKFLFAEEDDETPAEDSDTADDASLRGKS